MNLFVAIIIWLGITEPTMAKPYDIPFTDCPKTIIVNKTQYPWNNYDNEMLTYAQKRCYAIYSDAQCCKTFIKRGKQDYSVICGRP